jgi:DNA invertase Pin-like site-specific DNA recombinase
MTKATIKSKSGAVVTIEGSEKEVASVLATLERATIVERTKGLMTKTQAAKKERKKRATASDLVIGLKEDGFFDRPKGLMEISKALEEGGYLYPVTTLSGVMLGLVQKKLVGRKKIEGRWVYGK